MTRRAGVSGSLQPVTLAISPDFPHGLFPFVGTDLSPGRCRFVTTRCFNLQVMLRAIFLSWFMVLAATAADTRPNIIVLLASQLGYGDLGCYRGTTPTPHLDALAAGGTRALHYYSSAASEWSHASLLTGRHPVRLGLADAPAGAAPRLPTNIVTLPRLLQEAGYATAHAGRWPVAEADPREHGFALAPARAGEPAPLPKQGEEAVQRLDQLAAGGRPFFLMVWLDTPLVPQTASPEEAARRHRDGVRELDTAVGRLTTRLHQLGLESNTVVVFTAAAGPGPGGNTWIFRGEAGTLFEGGLRVPLLARWPGVIKAGRMVSPVLLTTDLWPTLCAAAGVKPVEDTGTDGINVLEYLKGSVPAPVRPSFVWYQPPVAAAYERHGIRAPYPDEAVLFERWKVLFARGRPVAVFNLYLDSAERSDVMNLPKEQGALEKVPPVLEKWRATMGLPPHPAAAEEISAQPPAR